MMGCNRNSVTVVKYFTGYSYFSSEKQVKYASKKLKSCDTTQPETEREK